MAEDLSLRERVKRLMADFDSLYGLVTQLSQWAIIYGPFSTAAFSSVAEMLASDATKWTSAECKNYLPGDGTMSLWIKSSDQARLPNGTDILQTASGISVVRIFVREADGGVVVPGAGLSTYTVTVPVAVQTIADFRNSLFDTDLVWVTDPARPMAFKKGNLTTDDDGVNGLTNAAGVHYDRMRFE